MNLRTSKCFKEIGVRNNRMCFAVSDMTGLVHEPKKHLFTAFLQGKCPALIAIELPAPKEKVSCTTLKRKLQLLYFQVHALATAQQIPKHMHVVLLGFSLHKYSDSKLCSSMVTSEKGQHVWWVRGTSEKKRQEVRACGSFLWSHCKCMNLKIRQSNWNFF